ncbi:14848_t:CDS:2 [Cetraspora pellucida]|uniref:14848_t:CDS:1 n=1 Tax=Cetraspora pellucida TaxID=1433469 RepID=A0ACA9LKX3_9GLOM|nr:14848_t:CDS:2 [Cetraspora pellucida]
MALDCGHLFHRICLEIHIIWGATKYPTCPTCKTDIEIFREELGLASGECFVAPISYDKGQTSQQSNITIEGDEGELEIMQNMELIEDDSVPAKQVSKEDQTIIPIVDNSVSMQDRATSLINNETTTNIYIMKDSTKQLKPTNSEDQSNDITMKENNTQERDIVQSLLEELSTPIKGKTVKAMIDKDEDNKNSAPKNLSILYQKACRAEMRVMKAKQEEITCWYYYGKEFEKRIKAILKNERGVRDQSARNQVYNEIVQHILGYLKDNLCKKTQWGIKIYKLFRKIVVNKIKRILSYGANTISKLTVTQIQLIE